MNHSQHIIIAELRRRKDRYTPTQELSQVTGFAPSTIRRVVQEARSAGFHIWAGYHGGFKLVGDNQ